MPEKTPTAATEAEQEESKEGHRHRVVEREQAEQDEALDEARMDAQQVNAEAKRVRGLMMESEVLEQASKLQSKLQVNGGVVTAVTANGVWPRGSRRERTV